MRVLVKKMSKMGLLKAYLVIGALIMAAAVIGLPLGMALADVEMMKNPYILGTLGVAMVLFALVGYCLFIRPYILYHKFPEVQAETDGEFLYIHTKKEAKIPLANIERIYVNADLPYIYQKEFLAEFLVHIFSNEYGDIRLEIPGYGKYKMRFIGQVKDTANELTAFLEGVMNRA